MDFNGLDDSLEAHDFEPRLAVHFGSGLGLVAFDAECTGELRSTPGVGEVHQRDSRCAFGSAAFEDGGRHEVWFRRCDSEVSR